MLSVAIVDYGLGNIFSVRRACESVGLRSVITCSADEIANSSAVILPGVGAFPSAMAALRERDLVDPLVGFAESGRPLVGICLGMQLLMAESVEFERTDGLGLIPGKVGRLPAASSTAECRWKVPLVGWQQISMSQDRDGDTDVDRWDGTLLAGLGDGEFMYFVHSYYCILPDDEAALSTTDFGGMRFCSSVQRGNVFGCQFHPERSGTQGLQIYRNLANFISDQGLSLEKDRCQTK